MNLANTRNIRWLLKALESENECAEFSYLLCIVLSIVARRLDLHYDNSAHLLRLIGGALISDSIDAEEDIIVRLLDIVILRESDLQGLTRAPSSQLKIHGVEDLDQYECYRNTRFTKVQLRDLIPRLQMPQFFEVTYNLTYLTAPSEFVFIVFLTRLAFLVVVVHLP